MTARNNWIGGYRTLAEANKAAVQERKRVRKNFKGKTEKKYTRVYVEKNNTNGYSLYGREKVD